VSRGEGEGARGGARRAVELPAALQAVLIAETARHAPAEACGVVLAELGAPLRICDLIAMRNRAAGEADYRIEHPDVRRVEVSARARGQYVTGFYHSHPRGGAEPSERDLNAAWPGYIYLIVGAGAVPEVRAWRLLEDRARFEEIPLVVSS
jgi:proteasome lid subunit RPN8/RPN11